MNLTVLQENTNNPQGISHTHIHSSIALRQVYDEDKPFGGISIILTGDFDQKLQPGKSHQVISCWSPT